MADACNTTALKDADGMIRDMLSACDINHDGQITYDEFVKFCDETEKELWTLFQTIDRDHNGNLDKSELSQAFEKAGVGVSNARLDRFFGYIDKNHDGKIEFDEWRGTLSTDSASKSNQHAARWEVVTDQSNHCRFSSLHPDPLSRAQANLQLLHHHRKAYSRGRCALE